MRDKVATAGFSERIVRALKHGPRPMSVRQLGESLGKAYPDVRGATYAGARLYASPGGRAVRNPRLEVLRAMADVLGVRPEWLAYDQGDMTADAEALAQEFDTTPDPVEPEVAAMIEEWPALGHSGSVRALTVVIQLLNAYRALGPANVFSETEAGVNELARQLVRAVRAPLRALGVDRSDAWGTEELSYLLSMSAALLALLPAVERARSGRFPFWRPSEGVDNGEA